MARECIVKYDVDSLSYKLTFFDSTDLVPGHKAISFVEFSAFQEALDRIKELEKKLEETTRWKNDFMEQVEGESTLSERWQQECKQRDLRIKELENGVAEMADMAMVRENEMQGKFSIALEALEYTQKTSVIIGHDENGENGQMKGVPDRIMMRNKCREALEKIRV